MEPTRDLQLVDEAFVPWGSFAFFGALIVLAVLIWLGIYLLMLARG